EGGAIDPDMAVDMAVDMAEPDMTPDMEIMVDAEPPLVMPGDACGEGMACPEDYSCVADECRYDLSPQVWRMIDANVVEPAGSAAELQAFLQLGVSTGSLNLMFESGTYLDDATGRTRWYIGNGYEDRGTWFYRRDDRNGNGVLDEGEDRNGNGELDGLPIQNFDGFWYMTDDHGPEWRLDGEADFLLVVPAGSRELEDGTVVYCDVRFTTTVRIQIWQEDGFLRGRAAGYLRRADVEAIEINFNGQVIRFADFLQAEDLIDVNGDGELDAYPFDLRMEAEAVAFGDDAPNAGNRDPNPPFNPHPACGG
ncbi:MAG: hypothetical protein KC613_05370, partial [Myxococcales bacterium]|nr:hypothetical protein [Myxococcales bacterium]